MEDQVNLEIYSNEFLVKPSIFSEYVQQFICSETFVLTIKNVDDPQIPSSPSSASTYIIQQENEPSDQHNLMRTISCLGETEFINLNTSNLLGE